MSLAMKYEIIIRSERERELWSFVQGQKVIHLNRVGVAFAGYRDNSDVFKVCEKLRILAN